MQRHIEITVGLFAVASAVITGTTTIEGRYAKADEVRVQMEDFYARTLRLRVLELQLKPANEFTTADRALLDHMMLELRSVEQQRQR